MNAERYHFDARNMERVLGVKYGSQLIIFKTWIYFRYEFTNI